MCGIVGYVGNKEAYPIIIKGLKRLEYRGYDSAGISITDTDRTIVLKKSGKVSDLEEAVKKHNLKGNIGIGHTRWATHGEPNHQNAHPHNSGDEELYLIHNGIIENYDTIKKALIDKGHIFKSETDTEVLIHLIEEIKKQEKVNLFEAVRLALNEVIGAYAIVIMEKRNTDQLIAARKGSPLVIGIGEEEYFIASDATPIVEYTREVVYLEDSEIAVINKQKELPGSGEQQDLGKALEIGEEESDIASAEQIQKTQSIESVGTVITETAERNEKILPESSPEKQ